MEVPIEKASVKFVCPDCENTMMVAVADLPEIGDPICPECDTDVEMDMGNVHISEANSC